MPDKMEFRGKALLQRYPLTTDFKKFPWKISQF